MSHSRLTIGIIGLPNAGKSTLFKALTKKSILIANYPFATIDPNVGIVEVPDERLEKLAKISKSEKIIPTTIEFFDIAGLVKGAHEGEGLGNQFLHNIREVDAIVEVVRVFSDPDVPHVHAKIDPQNDIDVIGLELIMADLKTVEKRYKDVEKDAKGGDKDAIKQKAILDKLKQGFENEKWARDVLDAEEQKIIKDLCLLTVKPVLYVRNVDENKEQKGDGVEVSAKIEAELAELPADEAKQMMQSLGMKESGLDKLIVASYKLLDLITFLTTAPNETRAWTVKRGTKAPQAAGVIHTDFEKGFIRVEVIKADDFINAGSETKAKEKALMRLEGKDYEIKDGDVCYFRCST